MSLPIVEIDIYHFLAKAIYCLIIELSVETDPIKDECRKDSNPALWGNFYFLSTAKRHKSQAFLLMNCLNINTQKAFVKGYPQNRWISFGITCHGIHLCVIGRGARQVNTDAWCKFDGLSFVYRLCCQDKSSVKVNQDENPVKNVIFFTVIDR